MLERQWDNGTAYRKKKKKVGDWVWTRHTGGDEVMGTEEK